MSAPLPTGPLNAQEFEELILFAFQQLPQSSPNVSPQDPRVAAALESLNRIKSMPQNWEQHWMLFVSSVHIQVQFVVLQTFQEWLQKELLNDDIRMSMRQAIFVWLRDCGGALNNGQPAFLRTKLAAVVALLLEYDCPILHDDVVDVINISTTASKLLANRNMCLKDYMRETDCIRNCIAMIYQVLVDYKRDSSIELLTQSAFDTLKKIVGWIEISLVVNPTFLATLYQYLNSHRFRGASVNCLYEIIAKGMLPAKKLQLFKDLNILEVVNKLDITDDIEFGEEVGELVNQMGLELLEVKESCRRPSATAPSTFTFAQQDVEKQKEELEEHQQLVYQEAQGMLHQVMPLIWLFFSSDSRDISEEVLDVVSALVTYLKPCDVSRSTSMKSEAFYAPFLIHSYIPQILTGILRQMRYSDHYSVESDQGKDDENDDDGAMGDEDEASFLEYRKSLKKIYLNICRWQTNDALAFLCTTVSNALCNISTMQHNDLEACLALVYHYGEGVSIGSDSAPADYIVSDGPFPSMLCAIFQAIPCLPHCHSSILKTFFEIVTRYYKIIQRHPDPHLLLTILQCMFGHYGLQHPRNAQLRSRVCYLLLRFCKSMGTSVLHPQCEAILLGIEPHLKILPQEKAGRKEKRDENNNSNSNDDDDNDKAVDHQAFAGVAAGSSDAAMNKKANKKSEKTLLTFQDQLYLFQLAGYLLGSSSSLNFAKRELYTTSLLTPQIQTLEQSLVWQCSSLPTDSGEFAIWLGRILAAIANVAKGFKKSSSSEKIVNIFTQAVLAASRVLSALPREAEIRSNVVFLMHQMVNVMGASLVAHIPHMMESLIRHVQVSDFMELIQLLNQLIITFHEDLASYFDIHLAGMLQTFVALMPKEQRLSSNERDNDGDREKATKPMTSDDIDRLTIEKYLFSFLAHLLQNRLEMSFLSPSNLPHFSSILLMVLNGSYAIPHAMTNKTCFIILKSMINKWVATTTTDTNAIVPENFRSMLIQTLVEKGTMSIYELARKKHIDLQDVSCTSTLREVVGFQLSLTNVLGEDYLRYLREVYFPSIGYPTTLATDQIQLLRQGDAKKKLEGYMAFIQQVQQQL